jgi:sodium-independent sulfate anion transporter 11
MTNLQPCHSSLHAVVINFSLVPYIDVTGATALQELCHEMELYLAYPVQLRVVGLEPRVRRKLERAEWLLVDNDVHNGDELKTVMVYKTLRKAVCQILESWTFSLRRGSCECNSVECFYRER